MVILDGVADPGMLHDGETWFKKLVPRSFVLAGSSFGPPGDQLVPFTPTLVYGVQCGVWDGPEVLDLVTLRDAVEACFHERRYGVEADWVVGPAELSVRHPHGFPMVALGVNPVFGMSERLGTGALLRDIAAVDEAYGWRHCALLRH